jgi:iron(III) transport system permease protein
MNSAFEEASRVSGASNFRTMMGIVIPVMLPSILAIEFLGLLYSLQAFEVEQILGTPVGLYVFSTWIYDTLYQQVPRYDAASAFAVVVMVVAIIPILLQRLVISGRQYTTVTGQFQSQKLKLGKAKWVAFGFLSLMTFLIIGVPAVFSLMGTFMKLFGFFIPDPWTLKQWQTALSDRLLVSALQNTIVLAGGTAISAVFILSLLAYVVVKTRSYARGALDFVSWLPLTVPGIILSLGLLTMFLQPEFRPLYGTMFTLVLALVISGMPFGVQITKGSLLRLGNELEEASRVAGGNWFYTYRRVVLPLVSPTLVVVGLISFIDAAKNIPQVALLSNTSIRPLSLMQLDYIFTGKYEVAAVIATILLFVCLGLALLARVFGYKGVS